MGVAGWRGGTTDLCHGRQKPLRGAPPLIMANYDSRICNWRRTRWPL